VRANAAEGFVKVNVISESAFTVQGHGVHTAFVETVRMLKDYTDADVESNTNRPADIIHIHTVGPYSLKKLLFNRGHKVVSAHVVPDSFVGSLVGARLWYPLAKLYLRYFYNRADAVLAVSSEVVDQLGALGVKKKVYLVPNTIETAEFASSPEKKATAREHLNLDPGKFIVMCSGQVQPRKRIDTFLEMAKALPEIQFVWVGGIPFKQFAASSRAMARIMDNPPANLRFTGVIPREDVVAYYHAADLFFLPSEQETFGIVIIEGAAAGLPVLLRDIPQYRKTFGEGYEKGTDDTFAGIIRRFQNDQEYYRHWQAEAVHITDKYNSKVGAAHLIEIYREVSGVR
jgi:1,2-diacylglycerol-3-alpha-glucose alpha-1,2-galactosyltransferase